MSASDRNQHEFGPITFESHPWDPRTFYATRSAIRRHSGPYEAAVPLKIADLDPVPLLDGETLTEADEATRQLIRLDEYVDAKWGDSSGEIAPMSSILLRTESASSSQIENLTVGARQLALFELGESRATNAKLVGSNVRAMETALRLGGAVTADSILRIHRALLSGEDPEAGRLRTQQVWIGGSNVGPHLATFVPPHADRVPDAVADLEVFCQRADIPPLAQIAVAHAQFETIHPFTDGNGRTGRAIVQSMMKLTGLTGRTTVPVSSGLLVDLDRYFGALTSFRDGDLQPIVLEFSRASQFAAIEGRKLIDDLDSIRISAASRLSARKDSAAWRLNDLLISQPVVNARYVAEALGISRVAAHSAIDKLTEADVLTESTKRVRNRVWQANDILARLDEFATQIRRPA